MKLVAVILFVLLIIGYLIWLFHVNLYAGVFTRMLLYKNESVAKVNVSVEIAYLPDAILHKDWPFITLMNTLNVKYSIYDITNDSVLVPLDGIVRCEEIGSVSGKYLSGINNSCVEICVNASGDGFLSFGELQPFVYEFTK